MSRVREERARDQRDGDGGRDEDDAPPVAITNLSSAGEEKCSGLPRAHGSVAEQRERMGEVKSASVTVGRR